MYNSDTSLQAAIYRSTPFSNDMACREKLPTIHENNEHPANMDLPITLERIELNVEAYRAGNPKNVPPKLDNVPENDLRKPDLDQPPKWPYITAAIGFTALACSLRNRHNS